MRENAEKENVEKDNTEKDNGITDAPVQASAGKPLLHASVRGLVEFVLRAGDIDNRRSVNAEEAMQAGGRIHRKLQKEAGAFYDAEVPLKYLWETESFALELEGRADGVLTGAVKENAAIQRSPDYAIDEIKGTYRRVERMKAPEPVHLAQAKCYAYMLSVQKGLSEIGVRMTYVNLDSEKLRRFYEVCGFAELEAWFFDVLEKYRKWAEYLVAWRKKKLASMKALGFPYAYREGQKELMEYVYRTICHEKKLFIEAPTGTGKTLATLFPALKAIGEEKAERIFYLTAKTMTRTVARDALALLREKSALSCKSLLLTAKEKICFTGDTQCNPDACPYARGHFDRVNDAMYALLTKKDAFDRETLEEYAKAHAVCPFELSLDMSLFSDCIVCDYNYAFDPHAYLRRFFASGRKETYLFLIDEAHNLVERGREMFSAQLYKEDFLTLKKELRGYADTAGVVKRLEKCNRILVEYKKQGEEARESADKETDGRESGGSADAEGFCVRTEIDVFLLALERLAEEISGYLDRTRERDDAEAAQEEAVPMIAMEEEAVRAAAAQEAAPQTACGRARTREKTRKEKILELYFAVSHFLAIADKLSQAEQRDCYVLYTQLVSAKQEHFLVRLFCVDPSENLKEAMLRASSSILFSATMLPVQYYKRLLGGEQEDYEVYARSVFDSRRRGLFIASDVTSSYKRRGIKEYRRIAAYIRDITAQKKGNYLVFFPSYAFMRRVYEVYEAQEGVVLQELLLQKERMTEAEREAFLSRFSDASGFASEDISAKPSSGMSIGAADATSDATFGDTEKTLVGFCVIGGIFAEGIDLTHDRLIGAIIVGTGLPLVCRERELLKAHFDEDGEGFDYAYRYPGMNKVLQAAGRVIRTVSDKGVVALLDERFLQLSYRRLFPREWENFKVVSSYTVSDAVRGFWDTVSALR